MIYAESRGDFYSRTWSEFEFDAQVEVLTDPETYVGVTEEGFVRLSLIQKIMQFIKGVFGGTDCSTEERIQAAWLKFIYYGEAHGLLKEEHRNSLRGRINATYAGSSPSKSFLQEIDNFYYYGNNSESKSDFLERLRGKVTDYHQSQAASLRPGFWSRLTTPPSLDPTTLFDFGDAPLQLMQKALDQDEPDPQLALSYLRKAFDLKNDEASFQEKLADELKKLEDGYPAELNAQGRIIQELWIELAQNTFDRQDSIRATGYLDRALNADSANAKGRLQIGKLYLIHQHYELASPFLPELQKAFAQDPQILAEIGHAYWEQEEYPKAVSSYEAALTGYPKNVWKYSSIHEERALLNHRIGKAHLDGLLTNDSGNNDKAKKFFLAAVANDPTVTDYQEDLCEAYEEEWLDHPDKINTTSLDDLLHCLESFDPAVLKEWAPAISEQIMRYSEHFFKAHQNQQAHAYLEEALRLFPDQIDLKIKAVDLATRYHDPIPLHTKFDAWTHANYANPYLKMKMGDAYLSTDKTKALDAYEEALDLFAKREASSSNDQEKSNCQKCMAEIQAKVAQEHLQRPPGFFQGVDYEQALQRLEKAARLNPTHGAQLFDAYLAAAQAEKQRTALLRDTNKIIDYYRRAFESLYKKGEYLIDLLKLCLDSKRHDDAVSLYYEIQKQTWSGEFALPADLYNRLAHKLLERKDYQAAHACAKQAHLKEPENKQFKKDYFQLAYNFADEDYKKLLRESSLQNDEFLEKLQELADSLRECWDKGFEGNKTSKKECQALLLRIYRSLAQAYLQQTLIDQSSDIYLVKGEVAKHREKNKKVIQQALHCLNEGLAVDPENAESHFDRGLVLEYWLIDYDEAFNAYESAVKYQERNPYYHYLLGQMYAVHKYNTEKKDKHFKLATDIAEESGYERFLEERKIFNKEMLYQQKSKVIDPHSYTHKKKGWFG